MARARNDERRIPIAQLFHGISKQPASRRHSGQVEDAINVSLSPVDGISKRPGSQWLSSIDANAPTSFTNGDWTASTKTITSTGAFASYTWAVGHYVFIRLAGGDVLWGYYRIASKTDANNIVLTESIADDDQTGIITSGWATDTNYRMHTIKRDSNEQYIVIYGEGMVRVFDTSGREQILRITESALRYLFGWSFGGEEIQTGADADNMVLTTSADYTLVCNKGVVLAAETTEDYSFTEKTSVDEMFDDSTTYVNGDKFFAKTGGRGLPSGFYEYQAGAVTFANLRSQWTGQVWSDPNVYNGVSGVSSFGIDFYESDGTVYRLRITAIDIVGASTMDQVASQFGNAISTALQAKTGGGHIVNVTWEDSTANRGRFIFTSPFNGAGSKVRGIFRVGAGNLYDHWGNRFPFADVSYVDGKGQSGGSLTLAERFNRIAVPGQLGGLPIPLRSPHAMTRFSIGDTDDNGVFWPGEWEFDAITWEPRKSGSAISNPAPIIFQAPDQAGADQDGEQLSDMGFHLGRLVFGAGEHIVMSQSGDLFNFYVDDATNLVDSDPISKPMSSNEVSNIDHILPFRKSLLISTRAGSQYELNSPEALTPSTAALTKSTSYSMIENMRPVPIGDSLYFMAKKATAGALFEYFYDDTRVSNFANDVTLHVQNLLPVDIRSMASSPNNRMVFIVPLDCERIYVYFVWWDGNKKVQSAWAAWEFDSSYRIIDIGVIDNELFMLSETNSVLHLEKMDVQRQVL